MGKKATFKAAVADGRYENHAQFKAWRDDHAMSDAWHAAGERCRNKFKVDMFAAYDVTGNPKAEKALDIAWRRAGGFYDLVDVVTYFEELAELIA